MARLMKPTGLNKNFPLPRLVAKQDLPPMIKAMIATGRMEQNVEAYKAGKYAIFLAAPTEESPTWHMSISHTEHYPEWDAITFYRYKLLPADAQVVMFLPPVDEYVNLHPRTFHLYTMEMQGNTAAPLE